MGRIRILPYRQGSKSAKALAEALGGKVLKLEGSKYKAKPEDSIINWGNTNPTSQSCPGFYAALGGTVHTYFNPPMLIRGVSNKLTFFNGQKGDNSDLIPRFWEDIDQIPDDAFPVVCRKVLSGHSGEGIHIADTRDDLVPAPLYVEYKKKKDEYRVHLGLVGEKQGYPWCEGSPYAETISVQRKARRLSVPDGEVNWKVRNLAGGFVYVRDEVVAPEPVIYAAKRCFMQTGLDFGAVDVIWNASEERAYVLEINTAPGLEGQTVTDYANFFKGEDT